jgi:hypothetical protein
MTCEHEWSEGERHENDDRIRTFQVCPCGARRYGCYAKRLGMPESECPRSDGDEPLGAWGPVGIWTYSVELGEAQA